MTEKEFRDTAWDDFEFSYNGVWYYICPVNGRYSAGQAGEDDTMYDAVDDLLNSFIIQGKPLKDVLADIDW